MPRRRDATVRVGLYSTVRASVSPKWAKRAGPVTDSPVAVAEVGRGHSDVRPVRIGEAELLGVLVEQRELVVRDHREMLPQITRRCPRSRWPAPRAAPPGRVTVPADAPEGSARRRTAPAGSR